MKKKLVHFFSAPQSVHFFMKGQLEFLNKNKFEVHVILPYDEKFNGKIKHHSPNVILHNVNLQRKIAVLKDIKSFIEIFRILLKIKPDIVHLHTPKASFIGGLAAKLTFQKNIIYQMHGLVSLEGNRVHKNLIYYLEKATCYLSTHIFAVSSSLKEAAVINGFCNENKIEVVGNGTINGIDWQNKYKPDNIPDRNKYLNDNELKNKFVVGFIGRICQDKGIDDFLHVIEKTKDECNILALIIGPNEMGEKLNNELKNYNLSSSTLRIFDEILDLENIIHHLDVLLFPTKREGFGLVAAEANAMRIPVVAYDIPGVRSAVENGITGKLVEYRKLDELKNALLYYYYNPQEKKMHGENGRTRVKKLYSQNLLWENMLNRYQQIINK